MIKIKKIIIILCSIIVVLAVGLVAVILFKGGKENNNSDDSKHVSSTEKTYSIKDNEVYLIKVKGKVFKAGDKISNVSQVGLKQKDSDLNKTIPSNRYLLSMSLLNDVNKSVFKVVPLNSTDKTINVSDAVIGGVEVGDINYSKIPEDTLKLNIEFFGGIKLGSTYEDIVKVFGEPDFENEFKADEKYNMPAYKTYTYSSGYKGFKFIIDDNGKVSQIEWNDYDYNE